jgi:hypothetical protein
VQRLREILPLFVILFGTPTLSSIKDSSTLFLYRIMCRMPAKNILPKRGEPATLTVWTKNHRLCGRHFHQNLVFTICSGEKLGRTNRKGCGRARFWICSAWLVNRNAYPGMLREGPADQRVRVTPRRHSSFGCLALVAVSFQCRETPIW